MYTIITFYLHGIFPSPYFGDIFLFIFWETTYSIQRKIHSLLCSKDLK